MSDHRHRMLLLEGHTETRTLLRKILTLCGWDVIEAATVAEALKRLDPPPDCILLDLELPDGAGEVVLRRVRIEQMPTRVVVTTGMDDPGRLTEVASLRPDALLQKPLNSEGLRTLCAGATTL